MQVTLLGRKHERYFFPAKKENIKKQCNVQLIAVKCLSSPCCSGVELPHWDDNSYSGKTDCKRTDDLTYLL